MKKWTRWSSICHEQLHASDIRYCNSVCARAFVQQHCNRKRGRKMSIINWKSSTQTSFEKVCSPWNERIWATMSEEKRSLKNGWLCWERERESDNVSLALLPWLLLFVLLSHSWHIGHATVSQPCSALAKHTHSKHNNMLIIVAFFKYVYNIWKYI